MTITVLTPRALEKLAAGAALNFAGSELFEVLQMVGEVEVRAVYCKGDGENDHLLILPASTPRRVVPEGLRDHREAVYGRMLSFAQRASSFPVKLPRGWGQYKKDNLLAFYALPEAAGKSDRWIAEVNFDGGGDIVFWEATVAEDQSLLGDFNPDREPAKCARDFWNASRSDSLAAFVGAPRVSPGVDMTLDDSPQVQSVAGSRTTTQWQESLTASQLGFVEADTTKSIRLRGPAGSGKTLSLCLKAVREVSAARSAGDTLRVLFVTHSWSLAGEVDALITSLSEHGPLDEIVVLPLVAVAQNILPAGMTPADLTLIGEDSLTGKMTQLRQISETIEEFRQGDWITYRAECSSGFVERLESDDADSTRGLAWDCLVEFGCVLGADGIFPGLNSEARYQKMPRAPWMMKLDELGDRRAIYALYVMYYGALQDRRLLTSDQLLSDFLNYLEGFTWNYRRKSEGFDLVFADEFHLFNTLERHTLRYLSREVTSYPRLFMAMDPRQSPWSAYFSSSDVVGTTGVSAVDLGQVETVDIPTVHRSSPQILDLIKHIHLDYANLNLDEDWGYSISSIQSLAQAGPKPALYVADSFANEETLIYRAVSGLYSQSHNGAQLALAIIDEDRYPRYQKLIDNIGQSGKYKIIPITNRDDTVALQYHSKGLVVGPAEYLAGLQFDTVLIAGLPEMAPNAPNQGVRRRGALSLLYLAASRASREIRLFANEDNGGVPEVLSRAAQEGVLGMFRGGVDESPMRRKR